jgi:PKD repeat protein
MIKGFCWSPASVETIGNYVSRKQAFEKWAAKDLGMIRGCQGNTVYTFLDFGLNQNVYRKILDSLYENGIMAIITVDNDGSYDTVNMRSVVNAYKNHPAVLMWALGNEWNINLYHNHFSSVQQAAISTEIAAQLIKSLDPLHPVASIYGDINITSQYPNTSTIVNTLCPTVDVWGLNIYRGNQFYYLFSEWAAITNKPMFLSEFGIDAFHSTQWNPLPPVGSVNETEQKDWNHSLWMDIQPELSAKNPSRQCLGGTYFEWNDEFWKVNPVAIQNTGGFYTNWNPGAFPDSFANEEFFGIASIDSNIRIPRESYNQIATDFRDTLMAQFTACDTIYGLCDIQGVRFYDLSSGSPKSWLWNFGDGTISTLPNPEHVYQAEGLYSVSLTVYYQNQSSTTAKANYIHAISCQSALSGINISNNQTNCYNATQVITVAGNNTTFSVQNGGSTTMIAGQIINFLPGTHVFQGGYCHGFISTTGPFCPSGGNPPPSNENSFNTSLTSIPGNTSSSFKIFPNPTSGVFTLEFQNEIESGTCYLEVYGITGNLMIERNLSSEKKHELSLSGNPSGLYFIRLITGNKVETRKVVKQ